MDQKKAVELIRSSPLAEYAETLIGLLLPSTRLLTRPTDSVSVKVGASRMGGMPDLPPNFEWPTWMARKSIGYDRDKRQTILAPPTRTPLHFLAQVNLQDIKDHPISDALPRRGMLYFFYDCHTGVWGFDPANRGGWRVVYHAADHVELMTALPFAEAETTFKPCTLEFHAEFTLPFCSDKRKPSFVKYKTPEWNKYNALLKSLAEPTLPCEHRMLGYPEIVQGDMRLECQLASNGIYCGNAEGYKDPRRVLLEPGADDWVLLLQIDSDDNPGWMWGDSGRLYFWIRKQDLAERSFDTVWCILQCY